MSKETLSQGDLDEIMSRSFATKANAITREAGGDEQTSRRTNLKYVSEASTGALLRLDGNDGDPGFSVAHIRFPPGGGAPIHTHDVEEAFLVIAGEIEVGLHATQQGGEQANRVLRQGDIVSIPQGIWRSVRNLLDGDSEVAVVMGTSPADFTN